MPTITLGHRPARADAERQAAPLIDLDATDVHPRRTHALGHRLVGSALLGLPSLVALGARLEGRGSSIATRTPGRSVAIARTRCWAD